MIKMILKGAVIKVGTKTDAERIGERIKALREKKGETQQDLAEVLGCQQNNISKIESNGTTVANLIIISEHYRVSMDYLCKGEGGTDLLDTLDKYVRYSLGKYEGIDENEKKHLVPHIEINTSLYNCWRQMAIAKATSEMPDSIREEWIKKATEEFNKGVINDNYRDFIRFIPLQETILKENKEVIGIVEQHIYE